MTLPCTTFLAGPALVACLGALTGCSDPAPPPRYPSYPPAPQPAQPAYPPPGAAGALPGMIGDAFAALGLPAPAMPAGVPWSPPAPGPSYPPAAQDSWPQPWIAFEDQAVWYTNDARMRGVVCGGVPMPPAPPMSVHPALRAAARGHSRDMAVYKFGGHISPDGSTPPDRIARAGYPSPIVGENAGAGQDSPRAVVDGWLGSPAHCKNLMEPRFLYIGVGYYFGANSPHHTYWTANYGG